MAHSVSIEQLLESGAHFGHLTRRWNPKMSNFIFMERNGIHIIDLRKTQVLVDIAKDALHNIASQGRKVLFVGTKQQAKEIIAEQSQACNMNYVSERWLGGMLTNYSTVRKSIERLHAIDKMEGDGTFESITKKERLLKTRERDRLRKIFGGIEYMGRIPGAIFVVDIKKEHIAIKEAKKLGIPVIALVDTNCDPEIVDYPIPANDDSAKTIELIAGVMAQAVKEGAEIANQRKADGSADVEREFKEEDRQQKTRRKFQIGSNDRNRSPRQQRDSRPRRNQAENNQAEAPAQNSQNEAPAANNNTAEAN